MVFLINTRLSVSFLEKRAGRRPVGNRRGSQRLASVGGSVRSPWPRCDPAVTLVILAAPRVLQGPCFVRSHASLRVITCSSTEITPRSRAQS